MHTLIGRDDLEQCRLALQSSPTVDEQRMLASELLVKLLSLYDSGRLTAPVLLLALDSLALIPELQGRADHIRATVLSALDAGG